MQRILNLVEIPECEDNENKKGSSFVEIEHLGHFNCQTGDILVTVYRPARFVSIDKVPTKILLLFLEGKYFSTFIKDTLRLG